MVFSSEMSPHLEASLSQDFLSSLCVLQKKERSYAVEQKNQTNKNDQEPHQGKTGSHTKIIQVRVPRKAYKAELHRLGTDLCPLGLQNLSGALVGLQVGVNTAVRVLVGDVKDLVAGEHIGHEHHPHGLAARSSVLLGSGHRQPEGYHTRRRVAVTEDVSEAQLFMFCERGGSLTDSG